jgi:hypothetical protein
MDEALRKIEASLREKRPVSKIDGLLPIQPAASQDQTGGLGIEHYGKVSMVVEGGGKEAETAGQAMPAGQPAPAQPYPDAAARIAAGSKELSLDELSSTVPPPSEALKTSQLGGSRFHELSLDDLSSLHQEEGKGI